MVLVAQICKVCAKQGLPGVKLYMVNPGHKSQIFRNFPSTTERAALHQGGKWRKTKTSKMKSISPSRYRFTCLFGHGENKAWIWRFKPCIFVAPKRLLEGYDLLVFCQLHKTSQYNSPSGKYACEIALHMTPLLRCPGFQFQLCSLQPGVEVENHKFDHKWNNIWIFQKFGYLTNLYLDNLYFDIWLHHNFD